MELHVPTSAKKEGDEHRFSGYLPRLPREYYQGDAVVHWTLTLSNRATGWLSEPFHARFREIMLHVAGREGLACPLYCLMPDHFHVVWMGLRRDSDQLNGMSFLRTHLQPALSPARFQHQPHDHVLREEQRYQNAFEAVCRYVGENPMRAGLVSRADAWPYIGALVLGYPILTAFEPSFWKKFWKVYHQSRHPDAGEIKRPPFNFCRHQKVANEKTSRL